MTFVRYDVAPPLSRYINFLYQEQWTKASDRNRIFPMPATGLKVNFGEPLRVIEPGRGGAVSAYKESWFVGTWNRHHVVEWPEHTEFIAVSFKPGGAAAFFDVPMAEFQNGIVPLDALWGSAAEDIRDRLHGARTQGRRFALFEEILAGRLRDTVPAPGIVDHVLQRIADRRGAVKIGSLCEEAGITRKHLITLFKRTVGCTPKQLARLHRFGHILNSLDVTRPVDWTSVAHANDYFDQSHFNHDFESHTGLTPTTYLAERRQVHGSWDRDAFALGAHPRG